jgi:hypothetical protein
VVRSPRSVVVALLAALVVSVSLGCALAARGAQADGSDPDYPGSTVHVAVTGPRQQGKTLTIVATGSNAADGLAVHISYGLEVIVVDPALLHGPCLPSYEAELTDVTNNPQAGRLLTFDDLNEGDSGAFRIPLRFTPGGHGPLLVCAYSLYITDDAAHGSAKVQIAPPGGGGGAGRLHSTGRPRVRRSGGRLVCTRGTWSGHPTSFAYRWRVGTGRWGAGGHGAGKAVTGALHGHTVACQVTAHAGGRSATRASRPFKVH